MLSGEFSFCLLRIYARAENEILKETIPLSTYARAEEETLPYSHMHVQRMTL